MYFLYQPNQKYFNEEIPMYNESLPLWNDDIPLDDEEEKLLVSPEVAEMMRQNQPYQYVPHNPVVQHFTEYYDENGSYSNPYPGPQYANGIGFSVNAANYEDSYTNPYNGYYNQNQYNNPYMSYQQQGNSYNPFNSYNQYGYNQYSNNSIPPLTQYQRLYYDPDMERRREYLYNNYGVVSDRPQLLTSQDYLYINKPPMYNNKGYQIRRAGEDIDYYYNLRPRTAYEEMMINYTVYAGRVLMIVNDGVCRKCHTPEMDYQIKKLFFPELLPVESSEPVVEETEAEKEEREFIEMTWRMRDPRWTPVYNNYGNILAEMIAEDRRELHSDDPNITAWEYLTYVDDREYRNWKREMHIKSQINKYNRLYSQNRYYAAINPIQDNPLGFVPDIYRSPYNTRGYNYDTYPPSDLEREAIYGRFPCLRPDYNGFDPRDEEVHLPMHLRGKKQEERDAYFAELFNDAEFKKRNKRSVNV